MTCTCGEVVSAEAATREEAVEQIKGIMNQEAVDKHMAEKHTGQAVPSLSEVHQMIAQQTVLAM